MVFTDGNMPNMDGLNFVKELQESETYKDIPIIMITTEGGKGEVVEALKQGVKNYVVKPFEKDSLLQKVKAVM